MKRCRAFYHYRRAEAPDEAPVDAVQDPKAWDADLEKMTKAELAGELSRIQQAMRIHRDIYDRERTLKDDRELYCMLPEKLTPIFDFFRNLNFWERLKHRMLDVFRFGAVINNAL